MKFGISTFFLLEVVNKHPNYIKMKFEGDLTSIIVTRDFLWQQLPLFCPHSARKWLLCGWQSWCGWQRLKAGADETYEHHDPLPQPIFKKLKPIYMCLASKDIFQRCLGCATQNAESFYGLVWSYCPRESLCGADTVACLQPCCTAIQSLHVPRPYRMYSWRRWVAHLASTTWMHWN